MKIFHLIILIIKHLNIHAIFVMEEYDRISFNEVWLIPIILPRIALVKIDIVIIFILKQYDKEIIGAIFCQVINVKKFIHLNDLEIWINHL